MIKRLRRKFVLIAAASVLAVELVVVGLINIINICEVHKRQMQLMEILCENDGDFPDFAVSPAKSRKAQKGHRFPGGLLRRFEGCSIYFLAFA